MVRSRFDCIALHEMGVEFYMELLVVYMRILWDGSTEVWFVA